MSDQYFELVRDVMFLSPGHTPVLLVLLSRVVRPYGVFLCECGVEMLGPVEPGETCSACHERAIRERHGWNDE